MAYPTRQLGKTGVFVSAQGLGCMGMSEFYGLSDEEENIKVLLKSIELGVNLFDTADMYGNGKNEELLSKVLKTHRDKVFLCTKFGNKRDVDGKYLGVFGTPEYVRECCEKSLKRLGTNYIDLYYQHRVDKNTPIEETVGEMAKLVKEGKVRFLGLSECSASTLRRAYAVHPIAAVQVEYSPWTIDIEKNGLLQACRELGVSVVAYSPLGRGFLTGRFKSRADFQQAGDVRAAWPRFNEENFDKNLALVNGIEEIAKKRGVTASQIALAWVHAQGDDIIPIPGTRKIPYLESNAASVHIHLSKDDEHQIRKLVNEVGVHGERYPAHSMASLDH